MTNIHLNLTTVRTISMTVCMVSNAEELAVQFQTLSSYFKTLISSSNQAPEKQAAPEPFLLLDAEMRQMRDWKAQSTPPFSSLDNTVSGSIWREIPGGHKWLDYFDVYDSEFSRFRNQRPRVLEIGVYKGASLKLWKEFFGDGATIVGVDIDPNCRTCHSPENGIFVEIGSQDEGAFLQTVIADYGPFDLIIDDGSHIASHQIASFNALFPTGLKDGGVYFVEDLECMYWRNTNEYRDQTTTSVGFFKMLIDVQNSIFSDYEYNDFAIHAGTVRDNYLAINVAQSIAAIKFYRGIALVEKKKQRPPLTLHL
ncbi:class I SAM-dependent methyltransferase [Agrobacterium leguminum]|uniref:class I SAM-dependent methyltransferase n=1 Tax=Agrobacterium leguminum TaxID=2792015 RepID=UPI0022B81083|nr:class I SAM-dependent methyltransferase [Agrobacterium leguminum]MCZ7935276.1 class I SAM-dependent methyltransferase [Agrobacterium leguminum]